MDIILSHFIIMKGPVDRVKNGIREKDHNDFTVDKNRRGYKDYINLVVFGYFSILLIICLFLIGAVILFLKY